MPAQKYPHPGDCDIGLPQATAGNSSLVEAASQRSVDLFLQIPHALLS